MHQVKVDIVGTKILQASIQCWLNILGVVAVVPKLCDKEDL